MGEGKHVFNGREMSGNAHSNELQRHILIHELGHWVPAQHYGKNPRIIMDPDSNSFYTSRDPGTLEENIVISLGGGIAEELVGFQTAGIIGDRCYVFEYMKQMYSARGQHFPWKVVFDMPSDVFKTYTGR